MMVQLVPTSTKPEVDVISEAGETPNLSKAGRTARSEKHYL